MMNTQQMIEMAKEREKWEAVTKYPDFPTVFSDSSDYALEIAPLRAGRAQDAEFIANAPRTILALADEVARLQARCAELERNSAVLGEWRSVNDPPNEAIERCLLLDRQPYGGYSFGSYTVRGGWSLFTQYGDGSEYPELLKHYQGDWYWQPLPPAPQPSPDQP